MDRPLNPSYFGVRRRIVVLFLVIACVILIPTFLVTYQWSVLSRERLRELTLGQGHDAWLYFIDAKRSALERTARLVASYSRAHSGSSDALPSVAPIPVDLKKDLSLDMVVVVDSDGHTMAGDVDVNMFGGARAGFEKALLLRLREGIVTGFWADISGQPWLVAGTPLSTGAEDQNARTFLVLGYKINAAFAGELKQRFGVELQFVPRANLAIDVSEVFAQGPRERAWKDLVYFQKPYLFLGDLPGSENGKSLVFLVRDLRGEAIALGVMASASKDLPDFGRSLFIVYWGILVVLSLFLVLVGRFLGSRIMEPLLRLREAIRSITESGDLAERLPVPQEEEMGALTSEFNAMLEKLDRTNEELKITSKKFSVLYADLLEQKKFTAGVLSAASSLIVLLLPDGRVKFVNEASESILGFRPEEVVGRNWFDNFLPFRARGPVRVAFDEILKGNIEPYRRVEGEVQRKDGSECPILWNNSLFMDEKDQVTSILSIGADISALKKIESELRRKVVELERFYRVTMDRERVIMQLKKEIAELRQRCG